ncbi:MAG: tetratricopeptide repeat protein [Ignavibacteria bacterium]|nr:tetratricopeptide repeat protein [Ignavibacteria bacterium]
MLLRIQIYFVILVNLVLAFSGCATTKVEELKTAYDLFTSAKKKFEEKDYEEATKFFDLVKLQYPASQYAIDAQYYLAEISFAKGEFLMAAFHYNWLRRSYPNSTFFKDATFKVALCYYNLSPPSDRDQEYTFKAIESFSEFLNLYPNDSLSVLAEKYKKELRNKLAYRNYFIAELYYKWLSYKSAIIYADIVLKEFQDTDYAEEALWLKINIYNDLKHYFDLRKLLEEYKMKYSNGKYIVQVETLSKNLTNF